MLTRLRHPDRDAYVDHGFQTDVRMLPQSGPLEGRVADTMRGHHETGPSAMPVVNMVEGREARASVTRPLRATFLQRPDKRLECRGFLEDAANCFLERAYVGRFCASVGLSTTYGISIFVSFLALCRVVAFLEVIVSIFVLDKRKKPLMPCSEKRARQLLEKRRAVVHRLYPFTIRLKVRVGGTDQPVRIKIDPGSKTTGLAIVREHAEGQHVLHLAEIKHRGGLIRDHLKQRSAFRRRRRTANLRHRAPRFDNRTRREGWLPPSLESRVANVLTWVARLCRLCPITAASQELVKFDLQNEQNPEISGIEYQQGTLAGYELREYLLEKYDRTCAYCDKTDVPLQVEHIVPRSRGGTDRVSNLTLACEPCNRRKGNRPVEVFLKKDPEVLAKDPAATPRPRSRTPRRSTRPAGSCSGGSRQPACRSSAARAAGPSGTARRAACPRRTGSMPRASGTSIRCRAGMCPSWASQRRVGAPISGHA